jgi:hypothetical protein
MPEIKFHSIAARCGSQAKAFEELCCQLAKRTCPNNATFERYRGAGGDGGVECLARLADGSVTGWQAKFVFDIDGLLIQAKDSLQTALSIHKDLKKYVVCFPFNPTGKTGRTNKRGRPAKSETDKLNDWLAKTTKAAKTTGRDIAIECWPASLMQDLILQHDPSGGIRHYFFSATVLSSEWFHEHLVGAAKAAGPRYTPELNVETAMWRWFAAFEGGALWCESFDPLLVECRQGVRNLQRQVDTSRGDPANPPWPANELPAGQKALSECQATLAQAELLQLSPNESGLNRLVAALTGLQSSLQTLDTTLAAALNAEHGKGTSNSKSFRTFMAQYQVSFPAANLDAVRNANAAFDALATWLHSPVGELAFRKVFVLSGAGGSGKTHGICDMALKRFAQKAYTCVLFGHQFSGQPVEWTRLTESLGLPTTLGKDGVLDSLNAAGEASGTPLIFCIDAVNETRPRDYWVNRFLPLAHDFQKRPFLKLCVSCRTSFLSTCLPSALSCPIVEHQGFAGIERKACNAFFSHYGLEPPLVPVLQPELSNPLYLKLVCETLKLKGLKHLPSGWLGLAPVIREFLAEKERQFAQEHGISVGAAIVAGSLLAIANAVANSGNLALPWSQAQLAVNQKVPQAGMLPVVEWLVRNDLLIEDGPSGSLQLGGESVLRPAFERFGDFLVAAELLPKSSPQEFAIAFKVNPNIQLLLATPASVQQNAGVLSAISILVPEYMGVELPDLVEDPQLREAALALTIRALPWRTPATFTGVTRTIARQGLAKNGIETMDSLLAVSVQPSAIDSYWVHSLLASRPIARRDAFWCPYLHDRFEKNGIVKRLIQATADVDVRKLDPDTASRWALVLLLFTAAADRRVKDHATRSAIAILQAKPELIPSLIETLIDTDDDALRERVLLCAYGALITSRDATTVKVVAESLLTNYQSAPATFQNAIIRDHIRCIGELAQQLGCLDARLDPLGPTAQQKDSDWPLALPTGEEVEAWSKADGAVYRVAHSCLHDDFNHYSINCLNCWAHKMDNAAIGGWILKHAVEGFSLASAGCDNYDNYTAYIGGGGRSKPAWAERIGKKYQWIALYQLASRFNDHLARKERKWEPEPMRTPLILLEERKFDPTLSHTVMPDKTPSKCWWMRGGIDLPATRNLDFAVWLQRRDDLPTLETMLQATTHSGQRWIILTTYPTWSEYRSDAERDTPYRWTWIHIHSYLLPKVQLGKTIQSIDGRNYFGEWLPRGGKWLHAFAGEYPWATAFNTEPDWYLGANEKVEGSSLELIHLSNEVVIEWEYDATLSSSIYLEVPTKTLFSPGDLWWNGTDGFANVGGATVFRDPHLKEGGPVTLLADLDDLLPRLDKMGYRMVWTMLGEKNILGDHTEKTHPLHYSQWAVLNQDGSLRVGKRSFFNDPGKNQGFAKL